MAVKLVVKNPFTAWGKEFKPGQVVSPADVEGWPEGTLKTRLDGGDLEYVDAAGQAVADKAQAATDKATDRAETKATKG